MPYKNPRVAKEKNKIYQKKWYLKNKNTHKISRAAHRRKAKAKWRAFKKSLSCTFCGIKHPAVIDFHHINRKEKRSVNRLVRNNAFKKAYEEVKKCIPLCANCHRILHYEEYLEKVSKKSKK